MANVLEAFGIKNASKLQFLNKRTKTYDLWLPWANSIGLEITSDEINGLSQGEIAITWSSPKEATLTISTQVTNMAMLAIMLGSKGMETSSLDIFQRDYKQLDSADITAGTFTLTETPKSGTLGVVKLAEDTATPEEIFVVDETGTTPDAGHVVITGKVVKFNPSDIALGDRIGFMYFTNKADIESFTVTSVSDSDSYEIYGNTLVKTLTSGASKFMQLQIFNATVQQSATITFDAENASTFEMSLRVKGDASRPNSEGNPSMFKLVPLA